MGRDNAAGGKLPGFFFTIPEDAAAGGIVGAVTGEKDVDAAVNILIAIGILGEAAAPTAGGEGIARVTVGTELLVEFDIAVIAAIQTNCFARQEGGGIQGLLAQLHDMNVIREIDVRQAPAVGQTIVFLLLGEIGVVQQIVVIACQAFFQLQTVKPGVAGSIVAKRSGSNGFRSVFGQSEGHADPLEAMLLEMRNSKRDADLYQKDPHQNIRNLLIPVLSATYWIRVYE